MKIQFLQTAEPGLRWMRYYYRINPQLDVKKAFENYKNTKDRIRNSPPPRETYEDFESVWEVSIQRTHFSILYTVRANTVFIIDIRDQRGNRSAPALRKFTTELKNKYE